MDPIVIRRLILHPGSPKTGTSGIQNALFRARDSLIDQGFLYPLAGIPTEADVARGHHDIAREIDPHRPPEGKLLHQLEALRVEVNSYPEHTVILSSEEFFGVERIHYLPRLLNPDHLTVYVSLRPQHEVLNANYYTQVTHNRITQRPDEFFDCAIQEIHYLETLKAMMAVSPESVIHLRLFEKGSPARSGPLADFVKTLGIHLPEGAVSNVIEHPTLPAQPTLFLRWLNEIGFDQHRFFDVFQSLHRMRAQLPRQIYTMSPSRIEEVTKQFELENREIRRHFIDGKDEPLFQIPELPDPLRWDLEVGKNHIKVERDFLIQLCRLAAQSG